MPDPADEIRLIPVPRSEPPLDPPQPAGDEPLPLDGPVPPPAWLQDALALDFSPAEQAALRLLPTYERASTARAASPALRRFTQAVAEVLAGARPMRQLHRRLSPDARRMLQAALGTYGPWARPVLRSARVHEVSQGASELVAILQCGPRTRALALRIERDDKDWRCTAIETA
ncbi:MAG: hypothetical protein GEV11_15465 [Streptosporangiales bacterium]|nr:hypothetical protein [Streptosporangiales bacterium]